jgi:hypothetical protein
MVPVKKVKLNSTIEIDSNPLRASRGASLNGKSPDELIFFSRSKAGWPGRLVTEQLPGLLFNRLEIREKRGASVIEKCANSTQSSGI